MKKSAPLLCAGALCVCVVTFYVNGQAQQPEPAVAKVETPAADETKPADPNAPTNDTEILASHGATFSASTRIAVFSGDVRVRDPRFTLACATLTVYLAKGAVPGAGTTPPPVETPAKPGDDKAGEANRGSGIDHALAEGSVIIIQKHAPTKPGEEEKVSIGRADIVEFDNKTGDMTLRGMPRVEQNGNSHEALSRSTWMVLHRNNDLETHGPCSTKFTSQHGNVNLPGGNPAGKGGTPPPAASPSGRRTPTSSTQG